MPRRTEEGPIEAHQWPSRLTARVVQPGDAPRIHGYDVDEDLAKNYSLARVGYLLLTGELPGDEAAALFETAIILATPISVAEAPSHAAVVVRLCGAAPSAAFAAGAAVLAEQAHATATEASALIDWLERRTSEFPPAFHATDDAEAAAVASFRARVPASFERLFAQKPSRTAVILAALHASGIREQAQLVAALMWARLPAVCAEARAEQPLAFRGYPMATPDFVYEDVADVEG